MYPSSRLVPLRCWTAVPNNFDDPNHIVAISGTFDLTADFSLHVTKRRFSMRFALIVATAAVLATPALAEELGVGVGPVGAGVTVGQSRDHDRDRERTTVIKEREPADRTTVIKKEHDDGTRSKTIIKERD
jgi:hypothetical protein